jgi:hypothetical protein
MSGFLSGGSYGNVVACLFAADTTDPANQFFLNPFSLSDKSKFVSSHSWAPHPISSFISKELEVVSAGRVKLKAVSIYYGGKPDFEILYALDSLWRLKNKPTDLGTVQSLLRTFVRIKNEYFGSNSSFELTPLGINQEQLEQLISGLEEVVPTHPGGSYSTDKVVIPPEVTKLAELIAVEVRDVTNKPLDAAGMDFSKLQKRLLDKIKKFV